MLVRFLPALVLAAALIAPDVSAQSFPVTFRFLPDLTTPVVSPVVRAFAPGTMPPGTINDWGPNTNGNIAPTAASLMTFDGGLNEYRYTETLAAGETHAYKIHYHTTASPPSYGGQWITDPLNGRTVGANNDSEVIISDPMVFQIAREQDGTAQIRHVSAGIFGSQPVTAITYEVNGVTFTDGLAHFDPATRIFRRTLPAPISPGAQVRVVATDALGQTAEASVGVVPPTVVDAPVPAGLVDGINLVPGDPTRATLVLRAPGKRFVHAIGDFSNWEIQDAYVLRRDATDPLGTRWWVELTGLTPGEVVRFQYLVDGVLRISDPYAPLVLDQGSDPFVPAVTFPNRPPYPAGLTTQLVAAFTPGAEPYVWQTTDYVRPAPEDLVIYELLVRDWVSRHDFQTVRDSLQYLSRLGVTAIQLMPVSEFDGNETWGYNPNHYFAVDKYYGPPDALKALVDAAHSLGMAVILDVVYNHQTGQSPFIRLFNQGEFGPPTADNPWANPTALHPFNVFNDNNHEAALTKLWLDRANAWWLTEYRIDGFRFDLSKGFTQTCNGGPCTDGNFSAYNQARINLLTRMADRMWDVDPSAYVILEHFADWSEERVLANHGRAQGRPGMMLWNNMHTAFGEAAMGYLNSNSDFGRAFPPFNQFPLSGQVTYMESHDEQWAMLRTRRFGACANAPGGGATCATNPGAYSTRPLASALGRQSVAMAFLLSIPGPKMIWQFGELGYGGGPGECLKPGNGNGDCTASDPGRVGNKPIRWDYFAPVAPAVNGSGAAVVAASPEERAQRRQLYAEVSNILTLRKTHDVFRTPQQVQMNVGAGVADRTIKLVRGDVTVVITGNFGLGERTSTPPLDAGVTWTDMISREQLVGGAQITLQPGQWRVFANQNIGLPTSDEAGLPGAPAFGLDAVFPNPATSRATVRLSLDAAADVRLEAFDVLGRRVATLANGPRTAGAHEVDADLASFPAGVYVLRLTAGAQVATARITVTR